MKKLLLFLVISSYVLVQGLNSAEQLVDYCQNKPMFRQVDQKKFLGATTTRRCYYNLTGVEVQRSIPKVLLKARTVRTLEG